MRIEQLEYLVEAAKYKSLTEAGERLHISQQALSASIRNMEEAIGVPLIMRTHRGSKLTEAGQVLARGANKLLADYRQLILTVKGLDEPQSGNINMAVSFGVLEAYLSNILAKLYRENSTIEVTVRELPVDEVEAAVRQRKADLGLVCYNSYEELPWQEDAQLEFTPLFASRLFVRVSTKSPLAQYSSVSLKTVAKEKILIYQPRNWGEVENPLCATIKHFVPECQFVFEDNYPLHHQMVLQGLGVAFTIQNGPFTKNEQDGLRLIPIKEEIFNINGCLSLQGQLPPMTQYLLNYLRMLCVHQLS